MRTHLAIRRATRTVGAAMLGAAIGATIAYSAVAALGGSADGAGYGGTAGTLQVTTSGDAVHVTGSGFLANSPVDVVVGDLHTSVTADDVGAIDAMLDGSGVRAAAVSASGVAPSGAATSMGSMPGAPAPTTAPTLVGASLGVGPSLILLRRRRSTRV